MNYLQIVMIAFVLMAILFPWLALKGLIGLPVVWAIFESTHKSLYRRELKCPYCGFDPTWYKKDVKLARRKVEEFLRDNPESPIFRRTRNIEDLYTDYQ